MTLKKLIDIALRNINVLSSNQSADGNIITDALEVASVMMLSLSNEGLLIPSISIETRTITETKQTYSLLLDFGLTSFLDLEELRLKTGDSERKIELKSYHAIPTVTYTGLADAAFWDKFKKTITLNSIPYLNDQLIFFLSQQLKAELHTELEFPDAYTPLIQYGLCVFLANHFDLPPKESNIILFEQSKAKLKQNNFVLRSSNTMLWSNPCSFQFR